MTTRAKTYTLAIAASLFVWYLAAQAVMGDSRQQCTASDDVCAWELR